MLWNGHETVLFLLSLTYREYKQAFTNLSFSSMRSNTHTHKKKDNPPSIKKLHTKS